MDGITLSIFFGTALGVVGAWILISITESKLWKKWMSKLDLCIERTSEPKSPLDREIAEEKKEIKFLTEQKAKIDRLRDLKREKDKLYWEIKTDEYEASSGETVYMPIKKWSVDNFKSDEINIESIKADEWHRCEQCGSTKVTGYRRDYGDGGGTFKYFEHCSDCGIH